MCDCDASMCDEHDALPFVKFVFDRFAAGSMPDDRQLKFALSDWWMIRSKEYQEYLKENAK